MNLYFKYLEESKPKRIDNLDMTDKQFENLSKMYNKDYKIHFDWFTNRLKPNRSSGMCITMDRVEYSLTRSESFYIYNIVYGNILKGKGELIWKEDDIQMNLILLNLLKVLKWIKRFTWKRNLSRRSIELS